MKILIASPYPEKLLLGLHNKKDMVSTTNEPPAAWPDADWVILYGYRYLVGLPTIVKYDGNIINIHISMLPYNRGADPNFWSWFENTPKGVSIHQVDKGLDTGPVYSQAELHKMDAKATLRDSYECLQLLTQLHFGVAWPLIRNGEMIPRPQPEAGTYHRSADKEVYMSQLPLGWDTPVKQVEELGEAVRGKTIKNISRR